VRVIVHPGLLSLISPALHSVYSLSRSSPPVLLLPRRSVGFLIPCFLRAPVSLRSASSAIGTSSCPLDGYAAPGVPATRPFRRSCSTAPGTLSGASYLSSDLGATRASVLTCR
jgi:hypothetical protein